MTAPRLINRFLRPSPSPFTSLSAINRSFGSTALRSKDGKDHGSSTTPEQHENQPKKPLNQFVPNSTSTMTKDYPNVGQKPAPPEMLNSVDPDYRPADPNPGKVEHLTGGRQRRGAQKPELGVGEMEGITFKVEPLKRAGEDVTTMRARLLCIFLLFLLIFRLQQEVRVKEANYHQIKAGSAVFWNRICFSPPSPMPTWAR